MYHRLIRRMFYISSLCMLFLFAGFLSVRASSTLGTIDPNNIGNFHAQLLDDLTYGSTALDINFGKFTAQSAYNITIDSGGLHGYAWGALTGWIVMDCADTASGCSGSNGNFNVAVSGSGVLSGYAWGENAGWINFGPFTNGSISQVKIGTDGKFGGTLGAAGYAWSEQFGWVVFDCSTTASCVETDYGVASSGGDSGGGSSSGSYIPAVFRSQCSNMLDDDGDGLIDYGNDSGCDGPFDTNEFTVDTPTIPVEPTAPPVIPPTQTPVQPVQQSVTGVPSTPITPPVTVPGGEGVMPGSQPSTPVQITERPIMVNRDTVTLPKVRDGLVKAIGGAISLIKELISKFTRAIELFMQSPGGDKMMWVIAIFGLVIFSGIASVYMFLTPEKVEAADSVTHTQEFLLHHEVNLTNFALFLFGAGFFASLLIVVFVPSVSAFLVFLFYGVGALLRGVGKLGSFASVFLSRSTDMPLSGKIVVVKDLATGKELIRDVSSQFGRVHLPLPPGVHVLSLYSPIDETVPLFTAKIATSGGYFRKRFIL